jgi:DNA-binding NtrC family response regulator
MRSPDASHSQEDPAPGHRPRALVVLDGEAATPGALTDVVAQLMDEGLQVAPVSGLELALAATQSELPDLVFVEMNLGAQPGLAALEAFRRLAPRLPVILMAHHPSIAEAVRMMQAGAESYLPPVPGPELVRAVRRVLARPRVRPCVITPSDVAPAGLVGASTAIRRVLRQVSLVAPTRTTVLLLGETGTGKERLAQAIHEGSPRRHGPFVAVNCAALAETILESELFGHEKGAFSGAHARREGRFKLADHGTIFLDEIGEVSPAMQVKLLRVLQERRFERVGGNETLSIDVRVIAATNRNLRDMVEKRLFRADLFYRLNVMAIDVPPLRARRDDVPLLVEHILPRLALELGVPEPIVSPAAMNQLLGYDWPGNVRELENALERAVVLAEGNIIESFDLPGEASGAAVGAGAPAVPGASFREIERHVIMTTYESCGRSPQRTAEILGISPRTVHYRLREYRGERGRRLPRAPANDPVRDDADEEEGLARSVAHPT